MANKEDSEDDDSGDDGQYTVEAILAARHYGEGEDDWEFKIRWYGYGEADDTWEPRDHLNCDQMLESFFSQIPRKSDIVIGKTYRPPTAWIESQSRATHKQMLKDKKRKSKRARSSGKNQDSAPIVGKGIAVSSKPAVIKRPLPEESISLDPKVDASLEVPLSPQPLRKSAIRELTSLSFDGAGTANIIPSPGHKRKSRSRYGVRIVESSSSDSEAPLSKKQKRVAVQTKNMDSSVDTSLVKMTSNSARLDSSRSFSPLRATRPLEENQSAIRDGIASICDSSHIQDSYQRVPPSSSNAVISGVDSLPHITPSTSTSSKSASSNIIQNQGDINSIPNVTRSPSPIFPPSPEPEDDIFSSNKNATEQPSGPVTSDFNHRGEKSIIPSTQGSTSHLRLPHAVLIAPSTSANHLRNSQMTEPSRGTQIINKASTQSSLPASRISAVVNPLRNKHSSVMSNSQQVASTSQVSNTIDSVQLPNAISTKAKLAETYGALRPLGRQAPVPRKWSGSSKASPVAASNHQNTRSIEATTAQAPRSLPAAHEEVMDVDVEAFGPNFFSNLVDEQHTVVDGSSRRMEGPATFNNPMPVAHLKSGANHNHEPPGNTAQVEPKATTQEVDAFLSTTGITLSGKEKSLKEDPRRNILRDTYVRLNHPQSTTPVAPRAYSQDSSREWVADCHIFLGNCFGFPAQIRAPTPPPPSARFTLEIISKIQKNIRFRGSLNYQLFWPLVLQSFDLLQCARVFPSDDAGNFVTLLDWMSVNERISCAPLEIPSEESTKHGFFLLFPPSLSDFCRRFTLAPEFSSAGHLNLAIIVPKISFPSTSLLQIKVPSIPVLWMSPELAKTMRGLTFAIAPSRLTRYTQELKTTLLKLGAKEVNLYEDQPRFLFIHEGTPVDKIPGLAHRRYNYPWMRFYLFGRCGLLPPVDKPLREVWSIGGLLTFTPRAFYENPFKMRDKLREVSERPFFDCYVHPVCLAFIANGLHIQGKDKARDSWVALDVLMDLINEGTLSLTSCPPPREDPDFDNWVSLNLDMRRLIGIGLIRKSIAAAQPNDISEEAQNLVDLCRAEFETGDFRDESELDFHIKQDLSRLQMLPIGFESWRRYVLLVRKSSQPTGALLTSKDGVESLPLSKFDYFRPSKHGH